MMQLQFKFDPLPTESAEICLFHERWIQLFAPNHFVNYALNMAYYFRKLIWSNYAIIIWEVLHKKTSLWALEKWKIVFSSKENENFLRQHCLTFQYHPYAQYDIIWTNYAMNVAIRLIIWLEGHWSPHVIARFWEHFLKIIAVLQVCYFS